jgi:hypothetical protein
MKAHEKDAVIIGTRETRDPVTALGEVLDTLPQHVMQDLRVPLGTYRGLRFGMVLHPQWTSEVYLEGRITRQDTLSREHQGPRAVLNAVERVGGGYRLEAERTQQDLGIAVAQLRDYQARVGQPFMHASYLDQLTTLRDQLKNGLSGTAPQEGEPTVAELADRIRGLQAANTVEVAPERSGTRKVSAEEPVTARIRRRTQDAAPGKAPDQTAPKEQRCSSASPP